MPDVYTGGWRTIKTEHGDTLQRIAYRELQDASRWPEIAWLNNLLPPYLTGDPSDPNVSKGRALLWGSTIRIPAPTNRQAGLTPKTAFGADLHLDRGLLRSDGAGGLALLDGTDNVRQGLELRLSNERGSLKFHPRYGNAAHLLKGRKADATTTLLALRFCEETVLADPRVAGVSNGSARPDGDAIRVSLVAEVDGSGPLPIQIEI